MNLVLETDFYGAPIGRFRVDGERLQKVGVRYQVERWSDLLPDLKPVLPAHYAELSVTKDAFPLDPDFDAYARMETAGVLHCITARDDDALVGYVIAMVTPNLHYRTCLMCVEDVYYLKPEYRKGRIGLGLFKVFESRMREIGVHRIVLTTKVHLDNSRLFEYLGYSFFEKGYTKLLGA